MMNSECHFRVNSSYNRNIVSIILFLFPFVGCLFMVWATIFYKPAEWYVTTMWLIGFIFFSWSIYHSLLYRAVLKVSENGIEYMVKGEVSLQLRWRDILIFKAYKSNLLDGTTAGALVPKWAQETEIGVVYSELYKNGKRTKSENILMNINEVHHSFPIPLVGNFKNKNELVGRLNHCKDRSNNLTKT